jgi:hypothetical protein
MSETKEQGGTAPRSQLGPWRWPLSIASLAAMAWFVYEVLFAADGGGMKKQSFGLLLVLGTITALAWVMGSEPEK